MIITVHRGTAQIGGCITEISTDSAKIIIDLGRNLPGSKTTDFTSEQIKTLTNGADAIFYTHYHGDHIGFIADVPQTIPQYIGEGAAEVMECKYQALSGHGDFTKEHAAISRMKHYKADEAILIKNIKITPYYCSHSAFDAYMFKIETEGRVILHTGDYRSHGYMGSKLIPMIKYYIGQVDVLITEGTMLSRTSEKVKSEWDIQLEVTEILKKHKYVFALGSSTDIDRLASFQSACKKAGRYMYVDRFQNSVLDIFTNHTTSPLYDFSNKGKAKTIFVLKRYQDYKAINVVREMTKLGFLMPVRCNAENLVRSMTKIYKDEPPVLIYSMWSGYWKGTDEQKIDSVQKIRSIFPNDNIYDIHTSGHADCATLSEVCMTTNPRVAIIPIHKDAQTDYRSLALPTELKEKVVTESTSLQNIEIIIK